MDVKYTAKADEDIIDTFVYGFLNFGHDQAERYEKELRYVISLIADNPLIARERPEYGHSIRIHHHAKHYIVYQTHEDHILIVRVLRDEMDLTRHLDQ